MLPRATRYDVDEVEPVAHLRAAVHGGGEDEDGSDEHGDLRAREEK